MADAPACVECRRSLRPSSRFCSACGARVAVRCAACGADLDSDARFCHECGTPVGRHAAASGFVSSAGVRKVVTVLFADLAGSTRFGERTEPEVTREVMGRYHGMLRDVVDRHGGQVVKFMGDGMLAAFGIPVIGEDDALRAVRAAMEMQQQFVGFADDTFARFSERLALRVGVNTGELVINDADADLVGDALNVGARLEKACRAGHVLVGPETWRLTHDAIGFVNLGDVDVTGRTAPVTAYEVAAVHAPVAAVTPFVGRESDISQLTSLYDSVVRNRRAALATVIGDPGVGKTRLSRELAARLPDAFAIEVRVDRSAGATLAPISQLLRMVADVGEGADPDEVRTALDESFPVVDGETARAVDVLTAVVGAARPRSVEEIFWAIRRFVETVAAARPFVLVVDDIQWAEAQLLDLLDHLVEWLRSVPVLIIGLARPELREIRPAMVEPGGRVAAVISLKGLDHGETLKLATGLLETDRLPAELVTRLEQATDGNPLFVRELMRMLVDERTLESTGDGWRLAIDADAIEVPATIQSLLAARIERLPSDERHLVEHAAVVGTEFTVGALIVASNADRAAISAGLERLRRQALVEPMGSYWGDEPEWRFHHVLIREAAYRRMLKATRAELHARIGAWTDDFASGLVGEHELTVARHFEQAAQYLRELNDRTSRADDLARRASALLEIAARRALERDDLEAAATLANRALALVAPSDGVALAGWLLIGCEAALELADTRRAGDFVARLGAVADGDERLAGWLACFEAQLVGLTDPTRLTDAERRVARAADTLAALDDRAGEAKARQVRAGLLAALGRSGDAEGELDLALAAARASGDVRRITAALGAAPAAALWGPSPVARAGGRCLDVVRLLRITTAAPSVEATSTRCQAVLEALRGRFDVARTMLIEARSTLEEIGLRHGLLETEMYCGIVELLAGSPADAVGALRGAYVGLDEAGAGQLASQAAALLSRSLVSVGLLDEADAMADAAERSAGENLKNAIGWRSARAGVLAARQRYVDGLAFADEAVRLARASDLVLDHIEALTTLMALRAATGDAAGAAAARIEGRGLCERKGATAALGYFDSEVDEGADDVAQLPDEGAARGQRTRSSATPGRADTLVAGRVMASIDAFNRGDIAGAVEFCHPDFVHRDRRSGPTGGWAGREAHRAALQAQADIGLTRVEVAPIATAGACALVADMTAHNGEGFATSCCTIWECDDEGLLLSLTIYDVADRETALSEVDCRRSPNPRSGPVPRSGV